MYEEGLRVVKVLSAGRKVLWLITAAVTLPAEKLSTNSVQQPRPIRRVQALIGITGRKRTQAVCQVGCEIPGLNTQELHSKLAGLSLVEIVKFGCSGEMREITEEYR